jgi:hypothetical protein
MPTDRKYSVVVFGARPDRGIGEHIVIQKEGFDTVNEAHTEGERQVKLLGKQYEITRIVVE